MKFGVVFVVLAATTALTWARYYTNSDPAATQALVPLPREHRVGTKATLNVAAKSLANRGTSFGDVLLIAAVNGTIVSVDINSGEVLHSFTTDPFLHSSCGAPDGSQQSDDSMPGSAVFPGRDGRILAYDPVRQSFHPLPLTAKGFAHSSRGAVGADLFVDGSRIPSVVALGQDGTVRVSSERAPVCDPVPRDTVWLTYLRRDDYLVRAVDPVQLKPQWNVSVGEIAADDIDAIELAHSPLAGMNLTVTLDGHVIAVGKGLVEKWRVYVGTAVHGIFLVDSTHPQANPKRVPFTEIWPGMSTDVVPSVKSDALVPDSETMFWKSPTTGVFAVSHLKKPNSNLLGGSGGIHLGSAGSLSTIPTTTSSSSSNAIVQVGAFGNQGPCDPTSDMFPYNCPISPPSIHNNKPVQYLLPSDIKTVNQLAAEEHDSSTKIVTAMAALLAVTVLSGNPAVKKLFSLLCSRRPSSPTFATVDSSHVLLREGSVVADDVSSTSTTASTDTPPTLNTPVQNGRTPIVLAQQDQLKIDKSQVLGHGCHGTVVYAGEFSGRPVAVKRLLKSSVTTADREIEALMKTDGHRNVVRYFAKVESEDFIDLVLERCSHSLAVAVAVASTARHQAARTELGPNYLRGMSPSCVAHLVPPPSESTRKFLYELVGGLAFLHQQGIVHRDVKPHNILLAPYPESDMDSGKSAVGSSSGGGNNGDSAKKKPGQTLPKEHHKLGLKWCAKISDMGLSKHLVDGASSFSAVSAVAIPQQLAVEMLEEDDSDGEGGSVKKRMLSVQMMSGLGDDSSSVRAVGTVGWQAPELLRLTSAGKHFLLESGGDNADWVTVGETTASKVSFAMTTTVSSGSGGGGGGNDSSNDGKCVTRKTRAVDVWGLGCVIFHVLYAGGHPFGSEIDRVKNILRNQAVDLVWLQHIPDAYDLVSKMIHPDPSLRPRAKQLLEHPFFWSDEKRLAFFQDFSDRLEGEPDDDVVVRRLERDARDVVGSSWDERIPSELLADVENRRKYNYSSVRDCIRMIRNKRNHFSELPEGVKQGVLGGNSPVLLVRFMLHPARFPRLLMAAYDTAVEYMADEDGMALYLGRYTSKLHALTAQRSRTVNGVAVGNPRNRGADERKVDNNRGGDGKVGDDAVPVLKSNRPPTVHQATAVGSWTLGRTGAQRGWYATPDAWSVIVGSSISKRCIEFTTGLIDAVDPTGKDSPEGSRGCLIAAAGSLRQTTFKGGAHVYNRLYKTTDCKNWEGSGGSFCPRGLRCDFAHGPVEKRLLDRKACAPLYASDDTEVESK